MKGAGIAGPSRVTDADISMSLMFAVQNAGRDLPWQNQTPVEHDESSSHTWGSHVYSFSGDTFGPLVSAKYICGVVVRCKGRGMRW